MQNNFTLKQMMAQHCEQECSIQHVKCLNDKLNHNKKITEYQHKSQCYTYYNYCVDICDDFKQIK